MGKHRKSAKIVDAARHYDLLVDEGVDFTLDPPVLRNYMNRWDGPRFIEALRTRAPQSALEIGVGTGRLATQIVKFCWDFTGIDISPKSIAVAREHLKAYEEAKLVCGDFLSYDFARQFDAISSSLTFLHIEDKAAAISKTAGLLHPGGLFLLSIDQEQKGELFDVNYRLVRIWPDDPAETEAALLAAGFSIEERWETGAAIIFAAVKAH